MADHGITMSLSHTSDDDSSDHNTPATAAAVVSRRLPPSSSTGNHSYHHHLSEPPPQKKPRGRPPGSKNKPKPPVVITQESDHVMKPVVIEVAAGSDVVEAVVSFARRRQVSLSVLSGSGTIANVTLRHPYSHAPALTLHGPFTLLSFSGSYIAGPFTPSPRPLPLPLPLASPASASASTDASSASPTPTCSSFAVSFSGSQGQIFGGVVAGTLVAASTVVVSASVFKRPEFHQVGEGVSAGGRDGDNKDDGDRHNNYSNAGGGDHHGGCGAVVSENPLTVFNVGNGGGGGNGMNNSHPADVNVMQWGHTLSASRAANY
ncbi:hypothetical protein HN51_026679 [Arachis hypogaea]|uniref:PPC domain-containing protein n=2 Tax=Arachis TaxID=3817 RepID=A0A445BQS6_ARAHY|nr:AT-hook motif nuclear-localized protein 17-like [Arachis hypogaea]XP_025676518.1 AT-hook motif nuclear-localized protein 17-like [Arachis hypogaea]XP_052109870.1 AT-hook motif nuclear-localized protein 17-like [Arachis duranensis]QHO32890.1 AT-hook motif nuclear-localized protein [Arachis hypogaea]RYR41027.1 hypothetical protein Ahy_A09g046757 [Arachis hypogaea]